MSCPKKTIDEQIHSNKGLNYRSLLSDTLREGLQGTEDRNVVAFSREEQSFLYCNEKRERTTKNEVKLNCEVVVVVVQNKKEEAADKGEQEEKKGDDDVKCDHDDVWMMKAFFVFSLSAPVVNEM